MFKKSWYWIQRIIKNGRKKYFNTIDDYYGSFNNYIKKIYLDLKDNTPELLSIWTVYSECYSYPIISKCNLEQVTETFINSEKNLYIHTNARKIFAPYLTLENMLDAILTGALFDDKSSHCLSGHGSLYFSKEKSNSFDECLADYDAIKKSTKSNEIIKILRELIGDELIEFLDNYLLKNREVNNGKR